MPAYRVTIRQEAYINHTTEINAKTAREAAKEALATWKNPRPHTFFEEDSEPTVCEGVICNPETDCEEILKLEDDTDEDAAKALAAGWVIEVESCGWWRRDWRAGDYALEDDNSSYFTTTPASAEESMCETEVACINTISAKLALDYDAHLLPPACTCWEGIDTTCPVHDKEATT